MWECDDCLAAAADVGYQVAVRGMKSHLRRYQHRTGWYSYGHAWREKVTCRMTRLPDGSFVHEKITA